MIKQIAILGAGSWGTALAVALAAKGHSVRLWARRAEQLAEIAEKRENRRYLPGVALQKISWRRQCWKRLWRKRRLCFMPYRLRAFALSLKIP